MSASSGSSPSGLLQRLRPTRISVSDVQEAAYAVLPRLATDRLRVAVLDRATGGPVVVLEEEERRVSMHLGDLAEDMADAGVPATPAGISAALSAWVDARPVCDAAAAATGTAVLDWSGPARTAVGWRIGVRRGERLLLWTPSSAARPDAVVAIRSSAVRRARETEPDLHVEGPVALWSHPVVPLLASAPFAAPERVLDRVAGAGLAMPDMHVVLTPGRPVAGAGEGVAARLAGSTGEPCVRLPWHALPTLPWL